MIEIERAEELVAEAAVAVATERDVLVVSGGDAASYLHGQLSQDVEGLAVGATTRTLLLQPQGKVDAWLRLHRLADDRFLLDVEPGHGGLARDRLERFKLRVDVDITLTTVPMVAVRGPASRSVTGGLDGTVLALDAGWAGIDGVDLLDPTGQVDPTTVLPTDLPVADGPALELIRILQGQPAMGSELDEATIPAAAGVVDASVDFTKGCYVGQELVARVDSRGSNTPTNLHRLDFSEPGVAPVGAELTLDGAAVGTVTSAAAGSTSVGLGYLKRSVSPPVTVSVSSVEHPGLTAEVSPLPVQQG